MPLNLLTARDVDTVTSAFGDVAAAASAVLVVALSKPARWADKLLENVAAGVSMQCTL